MPEPTGHDKTALLLSTSESTLGRTMQSLTPLLDRVLTIYEWPSRKTLDTHSYVLELTGHAMQEPLKSFLQAHPQFKVLGSFPRKY